MSIGLSGFLRNFGKRWALRVALPDAKVVAFGPTDRFEDACTYPRPVVITMLVLPTRVARNKLTSASADARTCTTTAEGYENARSDFGLSIYT